VSPTQLNRLHCPYDQSIFTLFQPLSGGRTWQLFAGFLALTILGDCVSVRALYAGNPDHYSSSMAFFPPDVPRSLRLIPNYHHHLTVALAKGLGEQARHRLEGSVYDLAQAKKLLDIHR